MPRQDQDQTIHRHYRRLFHSRQYSFLLQLKTHFHDGVLAESLKGRVHNNYLCAQTVYRMQYTCYSKCEKLGNMHISRLLCIILKTGPFIRDFEK